MSVKGMKFYHVNTRSIFSKLRQLDILYNDIDVLCCTETWLDNRFSDGMLKLMGKTLFRCDRKNNVVSYNARPTAGGVCIYMDNSLVNFTVRIDEFCTITQDFEILTLVTTRPCHRYFVTICVYKPPKGKLSKCIDFLNSILNNNQVHKKEIWILGDFNTDLLKRDDSNTILIQNFAKKAGLANLIRTITRPNARSGSCIDLIMTNCMFVSESGVSDDMISDHYTIYAVRKKKRETKNIVTETVRNYKNFNKDTFCQLLDNIDWNTYNFELNPSIQWRFIYNEVTNILSIMCPYKRVHTRTPRKKWLNGEIFTLIRERKCLIKRWKLSKDSSILTEVCRVRNRVNSAIDNAKIQYVNNLLGATRKDPKRFWRNIKSIIDDDNTITDHVTFKDPASGRDIETNDAANFVNKFFAEISDRTCDINDAKPFTVGNRVDTRLYFVPPERYEIMLFAEDIDLNTSSGVDGINSKICKIMLLHIPEKFRMLFANSLFTGYFPCEWTLSKVKLLPKSGDLSNPNNWRPISMTSIFSKLLEKIVHRQVLKYFLDNVMISESQFGFLPGRSTHEAIFKTVQHVYSAINNNKILGMLLLDIAKAFNCVNHEILYLKMDMAGFGPMVISWFKSYLNRTQQVILQGTLSDIISVDKGIAQGTVLGPILFIFYINDIFKCTKYVNMTMFADDCVMFLSGNNWTNIHYRIQTDFDAVVDWTLRNNLRLNHDKTKAMIFSTRHKISKIDTPKHLKCLDMKLHLYVVMYI